MKIALIVSALLNLILLGQMYLAPKKRETQEQPPLERFEMVDLPSTEKKQTIQSPTPPKKTQKTDSKTVHEFQEVTVAESIAFNDQFEQVVADYRDHLINKFHIPEEKLIQHEKLKAKFYQDTNKVFQNDEDGNSIKARREALELEEKYLSELEKLYGKKEFEKIEKYRQGLNKKFLGEMKEGDGFGIYLSP